MFRYGSALKNRGTTYNTEYNKQRYTSTYIPDGISTDEAAQWSAFLKVAKASFIDDILAIRTFSGTDTRVLLYVPPNDSDENIANANGYVEELKTLQTLTISSHRPPAPVRRLGNASATYVRGVRTMAGSMIFGRTDSSPFTNFYSKCEKERPDLFPFFIDQLPPFHIIIHAQNELGIQASMAILYCQLTDTGQPFSIDDLTQEDSYSYVCEYIQPFMDSNNWRSKVRDMVTQCDTEYLRASNLQPKDKI